MVYDLDEIKIIRKSFGLTQSGLAKKADVSQSLIAKIESKKIDPTYTKVKKIFDVLYDLSNKNELKAKDIMTKKIICVTLDDKTTKAIELMRKHEISQDPVIMKNNVIGLISENNVLESISEKGPDKIKNLSVKEIMHECPPVVSEKASSSVISGLLKYYPIVIVVDEGKPIGVITKSDMLRILYKD
ncbi:MAG: CBS domain-containing protein [Candidatus Nanoarchaeia archaeon]|nr:CBS domain-containing protein [Candidatus Nanoarchaeia archaeon]